jgi:colanic acid biosynthesis glycosyl transferase WcaI
MARILIYGINYAPELAGVGRYTGEIGEYLDEIGHEVTVVTALPHYPGWKVQPPYRNGGYRSEKAAGVKIIRCPLLLRERIHGVWRLIAPFSFALASAPVVVWQILRGRPDTVLCVEPTLFAAPIALLAARLAGATIVLHVQDLEVDAAFAVGHVGAIAWLRKFALCCERATLRRFDRIVTISAAMATRLAAKGVARERIAIVRNWVDVDFIKPLAGASPYRAELGIAEDAFVVLYSGNIGAKQGLHQLLAGVEQLAGRAGIQFVVAGEGPAKAELAARFRHCVNLRFLPFQPYARLSDFLGLADLHVLPQQPGAADLMLPSKLGGMLASGKRILVTAAPGTELATFLEGAAMIIAPDDSAALAAAIVRSADEDCFSNDELGRRQQLAGRLSRRDALRDMEATLFRPVPGPMDGFISLSALNPPEPDQSNGGRAASQPAIKTPHTGQSFEYDP